MKDDRTIYENYKTQLFAFLNDDTAINTVILKEVFNNKEYYNFFVKLSCVSTYTEKPLICLYGSDDQGKRNPSAVPELKLIGVWDKSSGKIYVTNWYPWFSSEDRNSDNPDHRLVSHPDAFDALIAQKRADLWEKAKKEALKLNPERYAAAKGKVSTEEVIEEVITGSSSRTPKKGFDNMFDSFAGNYIRSGQINKIDLFVEPAAAADFIGKEFFDQYQDHITNMVFAQEAFEEAVSTVRSDMPENIRCAKQIYEAVPEDAKTLKVIVSANSKKFELRLTKSDLNLRSANFELFYAKPTKTVKEAADYLALIDGKWHFPYPKTLIESISYRGKILYQSQDKKTK